MENASESLDRASCACGVMLGVTVEVGVALGLTVPVGVSVGLAVTLNVGLGVRDGVPVPVCCWGWGSRSWSAWACGYCWA